LTVPERPGNQNGEGMRDHQNKKGGEEKMGGGGVGIRTLGGGDKLSTQVDGVPGKSSEKKRLTIGEEEKN